MRDCEGCRYYKYERGDWVPYGNTYVRTPGGYVCEASECDEEDE